MDVLAKAGATVSEASIPEHQMVRVAQGALAEGPLSLFKTGFYGAFTRTYYPASVIAPINQMWASHADVLAPRTKLSLIAAELLRTADTDADKCASPYAIIPCPPIWLITASAPTTTQPTIVCGNKFSRVTALTKNIVGAANIPVHAITYHVERPRRSCFTTRI